MRTLGPGSVSSVLKVILEVVYVGLWVGAAGGTLACLAAVALLIDPASLGGLNPIRLDAGESLPSVTAGIVGATLYMVGVLLIVDRLRRVFATLTAGDPFHPDNVRRLRVVGLILAVLELGRYPFSAIEFWITPTHSTAAMGVSLTAWFAVLVVFVLAEVFREGARLRREAELTI